jgi:hypothetical protein
MKHIPDVVVRFDLCRLGRWSRPNITGERVDMRHELCLCEGIGHQASFFLPVFDRRIVCS